MDKALNDGAVGQVLTTGNVFVAYLLRLYAG